MQKRAVILFVRKPKLCRAVCFGILALWEAPCPSFGPHVWASC